MKKLLKAIGIAVVSLLVVAGVVILGSRWIYGPLGPFPGPKLTGPVVEEPVADWSSIDAVKVVQIETDPEDPYSVSTWITRVGNEIYVFAGSHERPVSVSRRKRCAIAHDDNALARLEYLRREAKDNSLRIIVDDLPYEFHTCQVYLLLANVGQLDEFESIGIDIQLTDAGNGAVGLKVDFREL